MERLLRQNKVQTSKGGFFLLRSYLHDSNGEYETAFQGYTSLINGINNDMVSAKSDFDKSLSLHTEIYPDQGRGDASILLQIARFKSANNEADAIAFYEKAHALSIVELQKLEKRKEEKTSDELDPIRDAIVNRLYIQI